MFRTTLLGGVAVMLATSAFAATMIKEIDVTADITAIENVEAAAYWTNLADDLEEAITARLVDQIGEEGSKISVDINELSLANSFQEKLGIEDAILNGQVNVSSDVDNAKFDAYELTVSAKTALAFAADGSVLPTEFVGSPEYYKALVTAFADGVVTRLK